jgi:alpha-aminoadipic semialdehyde synthase
VVFREEDILVPRAAGANFSLNEYYASPERYASVFERYLPRLSLLLNGVYWEEKYPRLVTKAALRDLFKAQARPRLKVIGDVSADINGAVECTEFCTDPEHPAFTYDPLSGQTTAGISEKGLAVMAIDNLPCEMPKDASRQFGDKIKAFFPALAHADFSRDYASLDVPEEIRRGIILLNGKFAPAFEYMRDFIKQ